MKAHRPFVIKGNTVLCNTYVDQDEEALEELYTLLDSHQHVVFDLSPTKAVVARWLRHFHKVSEAAHARGVTVEFLGISECIQRSLRVLEIVLPERACPSASTP